MTALLLVLACGLAATARSDEHPSTPSSSSPSLGELSQGGDKPLIVHDYPESLSEKILNSHDDGPVAFGSWRFTDASGQRWHALLLIEQSFERPADARNVDLRLTRLPTDPK